MHFYFRYKFFFAIITACISIVIIKPTPIYAGPCSSDVGSNLAGNWDESNLKFIRDSANCDGPIAVNVIFTPGDLVDVDPATGEPRIATIIKLMEKYNLDVTWRGWGNPTDFDPEGDPELFAGLQYLNGEKVFFGNEQNYCTAESCPGGSPNPQAVATVYQHMLEAGLNIEIVLPPLNMQNPNAEKMIEWQSWMEGFYQTCPACIANADYAAVNAYTLSTDPDNVETWVQQVKDYYQFLNDRGFDGQLIIAEAGVNPGAYQNFDERVQATIAFAQALESRLATDSQLNSIIDKVTFFLMDDATGKQFMVYRSCDANGVCTWQVAEYLTYNKYIPGLITPTPSPELICSASDQTPGFFRPAPCKNCGGQIEFPVNSCAESFYARQDTYFHLDPDNEDKDEVQMCEEKDAYAYVERTWKGTVTIDTAKTAVPFAGYHDKVDNQELNYLAQYFAGSLALRGPKNEEGTIEYVEEIQNESGVLAKVLPNDELDKMRCKRIRAATSDANENYKVPFKNNPNLPEAKKLSEFNGRANSTPCYRPNVPVEQNPTAWKQWDNDMVTWLTTDWAKLWPYIPLTTLKDAPGTMNITVQHNPGTLSLTQAKLTFPHLASLYESTKTLWEWLTPERIKDINSEDWRVEAETNDPLVANARAIDTQEIEAELDKSNSYCGVNQVYAAEVAKESPILLAQTRSEQTEEETTPSTWWNLNVDPGAKYIGDKTYQFDWGILLGRNDDFKTPDGQSIDAFDASHVQLVITAQSSIDSDTIDTGDLIGGNSFANSGSFAYNYDTMRSLTVRAEPGTEITLSVYIKEAAGANMAEKPEYQAKGNTVSMTCKINADGTIDLTTCKPSQVPPKDNKKCNNPDGYTPGNCIKDGLSDTKKNDFICSSPYPIETDLSVSGYRITLSEDQYNAAVDQVRDCFDRCEGFPEGSDERHECQAQCVWVRLGSIKGDLMNRKIGMEVIKIPYLEKVGLYTTRGEEDRQGGIFDIFRPAGFEQYKYKEAKSPINYRYRGLMSDSPAPESKEKKAVANSKADSGSGFLYYPWLGGVEMAKQCVSTVMLQPDISVNEIVASEYCPKYTGI